MGVRDGIHQGDPISVTKVETSLKLLFLIPILIQCLFICITRWLLRPESYIHRWINIWSFSYWVWGFSLLTNILPSVFTGITTTTTGRLSLSLSLSFWWWLSLTRSLNLIFCCSCYISTDCFIFKSWRLESSGCWIKLVMGTLDEVGVTREREKVGDGNKCRRSLKVEEANQPLSQWWWSRGGKVKHGGRRRQHG